VYDRIGSCRVASEALVSTLDPPPGQGLRHSDRPDHRPTSTDSG
jgi:hypothetical protein